MRAECMTRLWVFKDPPPSSYGSESSGETTSVVTEHPSCGGGWSTGPVPTPPLTGRVCHDRMRSWIQAGISLDVPWIHASEPEIDAARRYKQGADHRGFTVCFSTPRGPGSDRGHGS